jgi:hypothetical protein
MTDRETNLKDEVRTMSIIPIKKELREEWDKVTGPGLYSVLGDAAYQYMCERIKWISTDRSDPHTILVIGTDDEKIRFFKQMVEMGVLDEGEFHPWFFFYNDYVPEGEDDDQPRSTRSEVDTEDFCNFIRNARIKQFHPIAAVVILYEDSGEGTQKHLDKLLKIPVWRGSAIEKHIELPVFNVSHTDNTWWDFSKASNSTTQSGLKRTVEVEWGNEMVPELVEWLVPEFIPLYQATAFSGEMDTRKSTLALDIAAAGSLFRPWFMGTENDHKPFSTLVAAAEDTYKSTVLPRFVAAGGNPECLGCLNLEVKSEKIGPDGLQFFSTSLSFDEHLNEVGEAIVKANKRPWKVGLLINDPIISFFGNKSYNNPQDARDIMGGLKKLYEEMKITVINLCHFNKTQGLTAKQKTAGSKALIEAHRMAWAFDLMPDDPKTTLIAPIKHNLMKNGRSYKITTDSKTIEWSVGNGVFQSTEQPLIRFVGYSDMTADDRIEEKEDKGRGNKKELRKTILELLKDGPIPAGQVYSELRELASLSSLKRATASLLEEGKLKRTGTNPKNFVWELATGAEQAQIFDEVTR